MSRKLFSAAITVGILACFAVSVAVAGPLTAGSMIPDDVKVTPLSGESPALKKLFEQEKGIIIFFNTSCKNCLTEIQWVYSEYPDANVQLISIDLNGEKRIPRWAQVYIKDVKDPKIYLDPDFVVPPMFGISFTPASVLVDKGGVVAKVLTGYGPDSEKAITEFFE